jgi:hypothetical protein
MAGGCYFVGSHWRRFAARGCSGSAFDDVGAGDFGSVVVCASDVGFDHGAKFDDLGTAQFDHDDTETSEGAELEGRDSYAVAAQSW